MWRFGFVGMIAFIIIGLTVSNAMAADNTASGQKAVKESKVAPNVEKGTTTAPNTAIQSPKIADTKKAIATRRTINAPAYNFRLTPAEIQKAIKAMGVSFRLTPAEMRQLGQVAKFWQKLFSNKEVQASLRKIQADLQRSPEFRKLLAGQGYKSGKSLVANKKPVRKYATTHRTIRKGSALRSGKGSTAVKRTIAKFAGRKSVAARTTKGATKRHYATPRKACNHSATKKAIRRR